MTVSISSALESATRVRSSANAAVLALRERVAATWVEVATISASNMVCRILLETCPGARVPFVKKMSDDTDTEESTVHYALLIYTDPHAQDGDTDEQREAVTAEYLAIRDDPGSSAAATCSRSRPRARSGSPTGPHWSPTARSPTPRR